MKKTSEKSLYERKEDALLLVAYASLKNSNESVAPDNIQAEKSRLERIAESFFKNAKDTEYNSFILSWIKENARDIVYTDKFIYDTNIPDESFELNVDLFCRKDIVV